MLTILAIYLFTDCWSYFPIGNDVIVGHNVDRAAKDCLRRGHFVSMIELILSWYRDKVYVK